MVVDRNCNISSNNVATNCVEIDNRTLIWRVFVSHPIQLRCDSAAPSDGAIAGQKWGAIWDGWLNNLSILKELNQGYDCVFHIL